MSNRRLVIFYLFILFCLILIGCKPKDNTSATATLSPAQMTAMPGGVAGPFLPGPTPGTTWLPNAPTGAQNMDGAEVVLIQGGTFTLGSSETASISLITEIPQTSAVLNSFYIYAYEVTQAQYQACVEAGACIDVIPQASGPTSHYGDSNYDNYPVTGVDWLMAYDYCRWAGGRLPTEAEWEAAARSTNGFTYPWGNEAPTCDKANMKNCFTETAPTEVGAFPSGATETNVYDLSGNVWEWVNDWYSPDHSILNGTNPIGPLFGTSKVVKGGGYQSEASMLRSAARLPVDPAFDFDDLGFRCIANPSGAYSPMTPPIPHHRRTSGGERTVEGGGERRLGELSASIYLLAEKCLGDGAYQIAFVASNNFGGTYSFTFDGTPWSCVYDPPSSILACEGTPAAAPMDGMVYHWEVAVTHPTLGVQAWASFSGAKAANFMRACEEVPTTGGDGRLFYTVTATCPRDGFVAFNILSPMFNVTDISVNGTPIATTACTGLGSTYATCLVSATPTSGSYNVHVYFKSFGGETMFDLDVPTLAPATCPTGSDVMNLQVTSRCNESDPGMYDVDINWTPTFYRLDTIATRMGLNFGVCTQVSPGRVYCPNVSIASGGSENIQLAFANSSGSWDTYATSFMPPTHCVPGEERGSDSWRLGVTCNTASDEVLVDVDFPISLRYISSQVSDSEITDYGCTSDPFSPNRLNCHRARPASSPGTLRACIDDISGTRYCHEFSEYPSMIPTTCGGTTPEGDAWRFNEVTCSGADMILFSLHTPSAVTWIAGRAQTGTQTYECRQDPGDPHRIVCGGARPTTSSPLEVCIADASGTEYCNTYADFASRIPADCAPTNNNPEVNFRAVATCSDRPGYYNIDIAWSPSDYLVYRVDDLIGGAIASCDTPAGGVVHCYSLPLSIADGLLHVNVVHRASPDSIEEAFHPLDIIPPVCNGDSTPREGYALHDIACAPGGMSFMLNYPITMNFASGYATIGASTYTCAADTTALYRVICTGPAFSLPAHIVMNFSWLDGSSGEVIADVPSDWRMPTCGNDPTNNGGWGITAECAAGDFLDISITTPEYPRGPIELSGLRYFMIAAIPGNPVRVAAEVDPSPGPVSISFTSSSGNYFSHTFLEYPAITPRQCGNPPGRNEEPHFTTSVTCGPDKNWIVTITPSNPYNRIDDVRDADMLMFPDCTYNAANGSVTCLIDMLDSAGMISLRYGYFTAMMPDGSEMQTYELFSVAPPECPLEEPGSNGGWSIRQGCGIWPRFPSEYDFIITGPAYEAIEYMDINLVFVGSGSYWDIRESNMLRIHVPFPITSADLVVTAYSYDGGRTLGTHNFGPANAIAPTSCGTPPQQDGDWRIGFRCQATYNPGHFAFDFYYPDYGSPVTAVGAYASPCYWINDSANRRITMECSPARYVPGTTFHLILGLADGRGFEPTFGPLDSMMTECPNQPPTTPPSGGWDIQAWCEDGHPHLRLFPDPTLRTSAIVNNQWPGAMAVLTDYRPFGGVDYYSPVDVTPPYDWVVTDSLTWTFVGPGPDYLANISHTFTGLRSIIPAECGGGGTTTPSGGITPVAPPPTLQCTQITNPSACNKPCYWWSDACHDTPEPTPPTCMTYDYIPDKCWAAGCYYWSNGWCQDYPEPPPACSSYTDQPSCEGAGTCKWDGYSCYQP